MHISIEIQVLAWDGPKNVTGYISQYDSTPPPLLGLQRQYFKYYTVSKKNNKWSKQINTREQKKYF